MNKHIGNQTIKFENPPSVRSAASIVGPKEGEGPLSSYFDQISSDVMFGQETWEKAESKLVGDTISLAIQKAQLKKEDIDYVLAGDLLNQNIGSTFGVRDLEIPFFGLFGACSTMGEAMSLGAVLLDGHYADYVIASASSHFCAAEKTFRFPLELGTQRPLTTTWTVTGDGAVVLEREGKGPYITYVTTGRIIDFDVKDANNMGAAMAPAAVDTMLAHFKDTGRSPAYYDVIATGDLGYVGKELAMQLMEKEGMPLGDMYTDCGIEIFDQKSQDTHAGGSGCGCSATTFCGYFYQKLKSMAIKNILFIPTGALMNATTSQQGESIPAIAHAVSIETTI